MKLILLALMLIVNMPANSQTLNDIDVLEKRNQECLDEGLQMLKCMSDYYNQMDSMLNVAYKACKKRLSTSQMKILKDEQIAWLKKRDIYFKKLRSDIIKSEHHVSELQRLEMFLEMNNFIEERVRALIGKLK
ncbi:hypothetical protein CAP35_03340 [Chitinophagaceae bacterium IBVUCB1]|nr:hypothetical protein CAP35_03340 [Chitinophagaceae bacterium IBVUCB1]